MAVDLTFRTSDDAVLALQVAPSAEAGRVRREQLVTTAERGAAAVTELEGNHGGRVHVLSAIGGELAITYEATIERPDRPGTRAAGTAPSAASAHLLDFPSLVYRRQSRYCPSDQLAGFAGVELGGAVAPAAIASWVFERLAYEPGSSGPLDTAVHTLLANAGVCRDFAHLTIALCRALGYPSRLASVYAPGLSPMDFHAVAEVQEHGAWHVMDATRLAPRTSLVRIATGRDAADTAFADTVAGEAELLSYGITATVDGDLPRDDHRDVIELP